ncbi:MAG TPA: PQQ-binding-like beta-propeller repeat protein [Cyclobacteriaceae bacterium]|nr:PQQ-binding-like beta-propeller repeat protein [Cyclobacteriaceae bacterium]
MLKKFSFPLIIALFATAILPAQQSPSPFQYVRFHACRQQDGIYTESEYTHFDKVKWKLDAGGKIFSSPAVLDGTVYAGSEDHYLYAADLKTGKLRWKFKTGGAVHSSPSVFNHTVYIGSFDGYYYAVDAGTGKEKWRVKTGGEKWMGGIGYFGMKPVDQYLEDPWDFFLSSVVPDPDDQGRTIYFGSSDGNLYAVNAEDGTIRWKFRTDGPIHTTPAVMHQTVYVGSWDANFYAIDSKTGQLKWKVRTGDKPGMTGIQSSAVVDGDNVYFGARDAHVYCLSAATGEVVWTYDAEGSWILSSPTIKDHVLYVGTSDSYLLLAIDAQTGREKFRFKTHGYVYSSPSLAGNTAYFGDFTGALFALDLSSEGKCWDEFALESRKKNAALVLKDDHMDFMLAASGKDVSVYANTVEVMNKFYALGPVVSSAYIYEGVLYVGSADGFLYAIELTGGKCD